MLLQVCTTNQDSAGFSIGLYAPQVMSGVFDPIANRGGMYTHDFRYFLGAEEFFHVNWFFSHQGTDEFDGPVKFALHMRDAVFDVPAHLMEMAFGAQVVEIG